MNKFTGMDDTPRHPYHILRDISYEDFVEKKDRFDYLSWAVAWDRLKDVCPHARYEVVTYQTSKGNIVPYLTCERGVIVNIILHYEDENGDPVQHNEYLAVRGFRNECVTVPDAPQIENTIRRCVAKAVSMATGWGIELWFGEDIKALDYRPETRLDGTVPKNGEMTVNQGVKLDRLGNNRLITQDERKKLKVFAKKVPSEKDAAEQINRIDDLIKKRKSVKEK